MKNISKVKLIKLKLWMSSILTYIAISVNNNFELSSTNICVAVIFHASVLTANMFTLFWVRGKVKKSDYLKTSSKLEWGTHPPAQFLTRGTGIWSFLENQGHYSGTWHPIMAKFCMMGALLSKIQNTQKLRPSDLHRGQSNKQAFLA